MRRHSCAQEGIFPNRTAAYAFGHVVRLFSGFFLTPIRMSEQPISSQHSDAFDMRLPGGLLVAGQLMKTVVLQVRCHAAAQEGGRIHTVEGRAPSGRGVHPPEHAPPHHPAPHHPSRQGLSEGVDQGLDATGQLRHRWSRDW